MPCFHPLWAIKKKYDTRYSVIPRFDGALEHELGTFGSYIDTESGELIEPIQIPCGKCIGCRLDYSRQWANRCVLESKCYEQDECSFLTLTYNDENLTYHPESGVPSLYPKDLQDFIKRFRMRIFRDYGKEIRFYACGEYGDCDCRPHFHLLMFGFRFPDLKYKGLSHSDEPLYTSSFLDEVWGKGYCWIGELTWKTCAYTARYVMKKQKGAEAGAFYEKKGIVPEFVRMSLRPGIGKPYFDKFKEKIYANDEIIIPNGDVAIVSKPPAYFDLLLEREDPEKAALVKSSRKSYQENFNKMERELANTDLDACGYFKLKERHKLQATKNLKRNLKGDSEL